MAKSSKKDSEKHINFSAEIDRVLEIVTHALYKHKDIFLRELLSNAADAFDKRRFNGIKKPELLDDNINNPSIRIKVDKNSNSISVIDDGIGMSAQEMSENLGTIARSGTKRFIEESKKTKTPEDTLPQLIGQFGMGFYSCFMVAQRVEVTSKKAGTQDSSIWKSDGKNGFSITQLSKQHSKDTPSGTSVTVFLNDQSKEFLEKENISKTVEKYSQHIGLQIVFQEDDKKEVLQEGTALWRQSPTSVKQEDINNFYRSQIDPFGTPWTWLHKTLEGLRQYTLLLFIPSQRPFDLFSQEFKSGIRLYVQRVFITNDIPNLLPSHLRFVRGIVETDDMPLNVSRETIQDNPMIRAMRDGISSRILALLSEKAENNPEEYLSFWKNFGAVLKEGLYDHSADHESIFKLSRFISTKDKNSWSSLEEYISRMKPEQKAIYTITAETVEQGLASPQLEGFESRGYEVLIMTDPIDSFWINSRHEFQKYPFQSVTSLNNKLDENEDSSKSDSETPQESSKSEQDKESSEFSSLCQQMKTILKGSIGDVKISSRLTRSPVCLVAPGGGLDIHMEKMMRAQGHNMNIEEQKILEINTEHPLIIDLKKQLEEGKNIEDFSHILLEQARLLAGDNIINPSRFVDSINNALSQNLKL